MLLFDKIKRKQREPETSAAGDKTALAIARAVCRWQGRAASWLGRQFRARPHHMKQFFLLLFCLLFGGASGWILAQALLPEPNPAPVPALQHPVPEREREPKKAAAVPWPTSHLKQQQLEILPDSLAYLNHLDSSTPLN